LILNNASPPSTLPACGNAPADNRPTVSVVVCSYTDRRWTELVDAVASLQNQTYQPLQILVVVDHNPVLFERVRRSLPMVLALESRGTPGLSDARNTGIAESIGDVVAFLDDDAAAEPDWLEQLLVAYADPRVAGVGGFIEPLWSSPPPAWFPDEFRWVLGCSYLGLPSKGGKVRNLIGANMSFRRTIFGDVGGFRSELGHVGQRPGGDEETELCIRVRQRFPRSVMLYAPAARVHHHVPSSRVSFEYFRARCFAEGMAKARVTRLVGFTDGLATELRYTCLTLPNGVLRGLAAAARGGELAGVARAAAIVAGLAITSAGYARQTVAAQ